MPRPFCHTGCVAVASDCRCRIFCGIGPSIRRGVQFVLLLAVTTESSVQVAGEDIGARPVASEVTLKVADDSIDFVTRPGELEIFIDGT